MFRRLDVDRHLFLIQLLPMREIARCDAEFLPPMRLILHHRHRQVHLARMRLRRRRNRIKPRRDLVRQRQKFRRREPHRVLNQHIRVVPRKNVIVQHLFIGDNLRQRLLLLPLRQFFQHRLDEFLAHAIQDIAVDQQLPQRDLPRRLVHHRRPVKAQVRQQVIHRLCKIARHHAQRIARHISNPARAEIDHKMPRILIGTLARKRVIGRQPGFVRIRPVIGGGRGWRAQNKEIGG